VTPGGVARAWIRSVLPVASATLRSLALITIAMALILVLLPAMLGAAGPEVPIVV
jgi:hypothetical protein